jgi:hypothetical protein
MVSHSNGIYNSTSNDGVHWTRPERVITAKAFGRRTELHPIGMSYVMYINLHMNMHSVKIYTYTVNMTLEQTDIFYTNVFDFLYY